MANRRDRSPEALVLDPGVLESGPVCEFGASRAVELHGGCVVEPWRDRFRAAEALGLEVVAEASGIAGARFEQAVVHLQKSRAATFEDLAQAWRVLAPGGRLLLAGSNALGVVSAVKRLASQLDQPGLVVANRARARVVRFKKGPGPGPHAEPPARFSFTLGAADTGPATAADLAGAEEPNEIVMETAAGVFSANRLDAGSELLLEALPRFVGRKPPSRIVDLGCGAGVLGIAAARLFGDVEVLLADADARAVACARANLERLGLEARARAVWWDAREPPPEIGFPLALVNPPFHRRGPEVDLGPAHALFASLTTWLGRHGRALIVANRTLPYERALAEIGRVEVLGTARGYKLLSLRRASRSSLARGRRSPGSRSGGSSKAPIRSR